jgi:hypothetical protein
VAQLDCCTTFVPVVTYALGTSDALPASDAILRFAIDVPATVSSIRVSSERDSSVSASVNSFPIRAVTDRSFTSSKLTLNWLAKAVSLVWKYSGSPLKNVCLMSVTVSLLWTNRSTDLPALIELTIWSKNVDSPPTMSIRAVFRASTTMFD